MNFMIKSENAFDPLFEFEKLIADYFNAPYAVAVDCCTHGLEMCLHISKYKKIFCPKKTYISVPFMLEKIKADYELTDSPWIDFYYLTPDVIDAAVYWKKDGYIKNTKMCLSFHIKKHLNIGKGGMILLDDKEEYERLKRMRYDGRSIYDGVLYENDDIKDLGYHYYMTPETAKSGIPLFHFKKEFLPKTITDKDYSDVTQLSFFKDKLNSSRTKSTIPSFGDA